jgi:putative tryptophan/tyrosine transport system substrate-binding protein
MKRRAFIAALGGAATWPLVARGQQSGALPLVGVLSGTTVSPPFAAFGKGLQEVGYVEDQNVSTVHRWAEGRYDHLPMLASDLVQQHVAVIVATGGVQSALAAKAATDSIPIVFANGSDPQRFGLVNSLSHPGGNITGVSFFTSSLEGKRLGLLHELVPSASKITFLVNPTTPNGETQLKDVQEAASTLHLNLNVLTASSEQDLERAFATLGELKPGGLLVGSDPFFFGSRRKIVEFAAHASVPAIYEWREFAEEGGLASYGTNLGDAYRLAGVYAGKILKGERPAELPVLRSTTFEFVLNFKTAKALGIDLPVNLAARADEVIE